MGIISIKNQTVLRQFNVVALAGVACLIPVSHQFIAPLIGVYVLSAIIFIFTRKFEVKLNTPSVILTFFYFILAVGVFWSGNTKMALFDLEVKMALFIFPVIMLFVRYRSKDIRFIFRAFNVGLYVSSMSLLINAVRRYSISENTNDLFYVNLSPYIHPSYLSLYVVTGMVLLLILLKRNIFVNTWQKYIVLVGVIYLFLFNIFLLSKIGILAATVFLLYFLITFILRKRKFGIGLLMLALLFTTFYFSYHKSPYIKQRVDEAILGVVSNAEQDSKGTTGIRLQIWSSALKVIQKRPLTGYGTGDVKDVLMTQYLVDGYGAAYSKKLNAHNQFFQITIAVGLIGLLVFITALVLMLKNSLVNNNLFATCFVVLTIVYMLPESILENQAGTIFFGLFFSLLNQKSLHENTNSNAVLST